MGQCNRKRNQMYIPVINRKMKKITFYMLCGAIFCSCSREPLDINILINGRVQDSYTLAGVSGVTIRSDSVEIGDIVTGSDGYFSFNAPAKEKDLKSLFINIVALKDNYEKEVQIIKLYDYAKNPGKLIDFKLRHLAIVYKGTIIDSQTKQPLDNAKVHVKIQSGADIKGEGTVFVNSRGQYSIELLQPDYESWKYYITADASGYQSITRTVFHTQADIGKTITIDYQLEKE